jgi:hypothetical protein
MLRRAFESLTFELCVPFSTPSQKRAAVKGLPTLSTTAEQATFGATPVLVRIPTVLYSSRPSHAAREGKAASSGRRR